MNLNSVEKLFLSARRSVARLACCRFSSPSPPARSLSLARVDSIHQAKWDNFYALLWTPQLVVLFPHFHSTKPCSNIGLSVLSRLHFCNGWSHANRATDTRSGRKRSVNPIITAKSRATEENTEILFAHICSIRFR